MKTSWGEAYFAWTGGSAPWAVRRAIADGLARAAEYVKRTMRRLINTPYPPASKPGKPPHRRTGNLRNSIEVFINRKTLQAFVGPSRRAIYGQYLEFGTKKMKPRPFILKALKQEQTRVMNTVSRAAQRAFKKEAAKTKGKRR